MGKTTEIHKKEAKKKHFSAPIRKEFDFFCIFAHEIKQFLT